MNGALGIATLVLFAAPAAPPVPLAAAMVVDGNVVLLDVPTRSLKRFEFGDQQALEADLSPDKKVIAFVARQKGEGQARLFLMSPLEGKPIAVETGQAGDHRFPRFTDAGATVVFSAAGKAGPDGHENRLRLHTLRIKDKRVRPFATTAERCEFWPAGLAGGKVAHVTTSCFLDYDLVLSDKNGKQTKVAPVSGPDTELAASPDGKKLLYISRVQDGIGFFLVEGAAKPRLLMTLHQPMERFQPKFVCPRDVLLANGKEWVVLNSETGAVAPFNPEPGAKDNQP